MKLKLIIIVTILVGLGIFLFIDYALTQERATEEPVSSVTQPPEASVSSPVEPKPTEAAGASKIELILSGPLPLFGS